VRKTINIIELQVLLGWTFLLNFEKDSSFFPSKLRGIWGLDYLPILHSLVKLDRVENKVEPNRHVRVGIREGRTETMINGFLSFMKSSTIVHSLHLKKFDEKSTHSAC
jgi:hypothetical protein